MNCLPCIVFQYMVTVYTGEESKAGTDANVYLQIFGECGDTGYRRLMTSKTNLNKFEQGSVSRGTSKWGNNGFCRNVRKVLADKSYTCLLISANNDYISAYL